MQVEHPRILFLSLTNIGDAILSSTLLERIVHRYPECEIDIVTGPLPSELFAGLPQLRRLIPLKKLPKRGHYKKLYRDLQDEEYDYIFDLRGSLMSWVLKSKNKVVNRTVQQGHKALQCAELCPWDDPRPAKQLLAPDVKKMAQVELPKEPYYVLGPTANWIGKRWPQGNFIQLHRQLSQLPELKGCRVAIMAAPKEKRMVTDLLAALPASTIDLTNISLSEAYAWMQNAKMMIGHDSGLAHMAAAATIPTVTIFGPMNDKLYAPLNARGTIVCPPNRPRAEVNLQPPYLSRLITDVTVEQVLGAVKQSLEAQHD